MAKQTIMRTQRHGAGKARVTVLHDTGALDVVVSASGNDDPMTSDQVVEALRNAITTLDAAGSHIEQHVDDHGY